ncbi:MAG: MATE family efflux transporter [Saprospiraceae bacterium]
MRRFFKLLWQAIEGEEGADYTTGNINKAIFLLSVPMIIEMLGEGIFALVDAYFVSKVSNEAFATVVLSETLATIVYALAIGISIAGMSMVARRIGEKNAEGASKAAAQTVIITVAISIILSIVGVIFAKDLLFMMGASEEVVAVGLLYTQVLLGGNIVIMLLFVLNGIFRGSGDATMAMRSLWIANGINIVLDPLLIFGIGIFPEMGVMGAAIASTIGRGVGVLFQLYILFNGKRVIQLTKAYFVIKWDILKKILNIATTGAGQYIISSASWIFLMRIIADFGTDAVNGYGLAVRMIIFTILPAWGIANAAATLMGQNLGAEKPDRAATSVWRSAYYNAAFLSIIAVIYFIFAVPIISVFNDNENVIAIGAKALRIFSVGYLFFGFGMVINQAFGGAGDTRTPTLINFISFWLIQIPLAYSLVNFGGFGPEGVYWSVVISEIILVGIAVFIFKKGKWKTVKI